MDSLELYYEEIEWHEMGCEIESIPQQAQTPFSSTVQTRSCMLEWFENCIYRIPWLFIIFDLISPFYTFRILNCYTQANVAVGWCCLLEKKIQATHISRTKAIKIIPDHFSITVDSFGITSEWHKNGKCTSTFWPTRFPIPKGEKIVN